MIITLHYIIVQLLIKIQSQQTGNRIYKNTSLHLRAEQVQFIFSPLTSNTIPRHLTRVTQGEAETIADLVLSHVVEKLKVLTSKVPHLHALLKLLLRNDSTLDSSHFFTVLR